eukprot:TRINITY_DN2861_c0_g1_i1.p1 TRINITY_DN2861_c0_g1~~TRINITY_DN2861_c0_g1_i1.p1  ORF type:complete len:331 (+),score=16.63 TRINITY_DN2861_c0_g1_i1:238-1230(+)
MRVFHVVIWIQMKMPKKWIFEFVADLWSTWLDKESQESMRKYGRYSQLHPGTNLRIIGLTSFVQDVLNSYIYGNITDRLGQLRWLNQTLYPSEQNKEHVIILSHFPPCNEFANKEWFIRYGILMDRYANIIRGQFNGHTHKDAFQVIRSSIPGEFAGVALENPSVTSHSEVFPSYKIFEMDRDNYVLHDFTVYRFNLTKANEMDQPEYYKSYRFTEYYGVDNLDDYTFYNIAQRVLHNKEDFRKFARMLYAEGPRSKSLMKDFSQNHTIYCDLTSANFDELEECMGGFPLRISPSYYFNFLVKYFLPPWEYSRPAAGSDEQIVQDTQCMG